MFEGGMPARRFLRQPSSLPRVPLFATRLRETLRSDRPQGGLETLYPDGHLHRFSMSRRAILCSMAGVVGTSALAANGPASFSLGLTPVFLDNDMPLLSLLQKYLSQRLDRPIVLVKRRTYREILVMLMSGQLDAAWICDFSYVQYQDRLTLLAVPLYRHQPLREAYVIVSKGSKAT